ncbi:MAG TPA: lipase family protein [Hyphomicrobiaceae bacterium]|nr:lipase family protein [Hyphomicrobiaceae bacterium]
MPHAPSTAAAVSISPEVVQLLAAGPKSTVRLAYSLLGDVARHGVGPAQSTEPSVPKLLADGHDWRRQGIPLELCEFLAYKSALAYHSADVIGHNLSTCCEGIDSFAYFDSTKGEDRVPHVDTQGYGFRREGKAFIILRGTSTWSDWKGNLRDLLTDPGQVSDNERRAAEWALKKAFDRLKRTHGDVRPLIGDLRPGRHLGFLIGWAAIRPQVEAWMQFVLRDEAMPVVFAGHSLGGALAFLGAYEFATGPRPRTVAAVVTFGAPMVGGRDFADSYNAVLGERTVRIEARSDKVPELARRTGYQHVAQDRLWEFAEQPLVSRAQFQDVIRTALNEVAKRQGDAAAQHQPSTTAAAPQHAAPAADTQGQPGTNSGGWVLALVLGLFAAVIGLFLVKRLIDAHSVQQRYAAYLSTLSYQRLRQLRAGDLVRANEDLEQHLRIVRGRVPDDEEVPKDLVKLYRKLCGPIRELPVRLEPTDDLKTFFQASGGARMV